MNNKQLADKLEQWAHALAESGGQKWVLSVPVREDVDPDCLMIEAAKRLRLAPCSSPGAVWVNGFKRKPVDPGHYDEPLKFVVRIKGDDPRSGWVYVGQATVEEIEKEKWDDYWEWLDESGTTAPSAREAELEREVERVRSEYEEVLEDHRQLVRELDVLINGEAGAAKQASLCDIVGQVRREGAPCLKVVLSILGKAQAEGFLQGAEYHELARIFKHNL